MFLWLEQTTCSAFYVVVTNDARLGCMQSISMYVTASSVCLSSGATDPVLFFVAQQIAPHFWHAQDYSEQLKATTRLASIFEATVQHYSEGAIQLISGLWLTRSEQLARSHFTLLAGRRQEGRQTRRRSRRRHHRRRRTTSSRAPELFRGVCGVRGATSCLTQLLRNHHARYLTPSGELHKCVFSTWGRI